MSQNGDKDNLCSRAWGIVTFLDIQILICMHKNVKMTDYIDAVFV